METYDHVIVDKLKTSVIAKLSELDPNKKHDSTLIDYILVMVINRKSKYEMKHNLSLFLGKIVDDFVNWLFEYLTQPKMEGGESTTNNSNEQEMESKQDQPETINKSDELEKTETKNERLKNIQSKRKLKSAILTVNNESKDEDKSNQDKNSTTKESVKIRKRILLDDGKQAPQLSKKRSVVDVLEPKSNSNESKTANNVEDISKQSKIEGAEADENETAKENETKFLVTLDGAKDIFPSKDDLFLLDEDFDPELMREEISNVNSVQLVQNDVSVKENKNANKLAERCKYWPSCLNGDKCEFYHPTTKCNNFPYCRFGDKCLYIHPACKFDSYCSKKDCPFMHTAKRIQLTPTSTVICKYFPNCKKNPCEFFHPKVCHFGASCKSFNCQYAHLPNKPQQNAPHSSKFKWSSEKSNSPVNDTKNEIEIK